MYDKIHYKLKKKKEEEKKIKPMFLYCKKKKKNASLLPSEQFKHPCFILGISPLPFPK